MNLRDFIDRYGVAAVVVLGLAAVIALLPGNASDRAVETGGDGAGLDDEFAGGVGSSDDGSTTDDGSVDGSTGGGGGGGGTGGGGTGTEAGGGGGGPALTPGDVKFGQGPRCRSDGRQKGITKYMPRCVLWTGTDNGGATFRGVTREKVVVVRWIGQVTAGTRAILRGARLSDDPDKVTEIYDTLRRYSNQHYETYGREVVFVDYNASGRSEDEEAMKRDAINIAEKKPFAVIEGDPAAAMPVTLARALAQRNILCMCTTSLSSEFYNSLPPMLWSSLPTSTEYAKHAAEFIAKRMAGKRAQWAGESSGYTVLPRKFGLIYWEGSYGRVEPELVRNRDVMIRELRARGISISKAAQAGYLYEAGENQQNVTAVITKLKNADVTTVIGLWDPLYPILITAEATNQQYFPEWFMTGFGLSDTTTAGRLYSQPQWRHAFGISPLWVTWQTVANSAGAREYHHGKPEAADGDEGVLINIYRARIQTLFRGIHNAGPNLTNETFVRGQLALPRTGGLPALPLVFLTRQYPTEIKDFVEVYYDLTATGPDEREQPGTGMVMKVRGGRRYDLGEWPRADPYAFNRSGAIAVSDNPPGGRDPAHEQDGHTHTGACITCK